MQTSTYTLSFKVYSAKEKGEEAALEDLEIHGCQFELDDNILFKMKYRTLLVCFILSFYGFSRK